MWIARPMAISRACNSFLFLFLFLVCHCWRAMVWWRRRRWWTCNTISNTFHSIKKTKTKERKKLRSSKRSTQQFFFSSTFLLPLLDRKTHRSYFHLNSTLVFLMSMYVVCRITTQHAAHTDRRRSPVRCILKLNKSEKLYSNLLSECIPLKARKRKITCSWTRRPSSFAECWCHTRNSKWNWVLKLKNDNLWLKLNDVRPLDTTLFQIGKHAFPNSVLMPDAQCASAL